MKTSFLIFIAGSLVLAGDAASRHPDALSGGETTVFAANRNAFASPAANLPVEDLRRFAAGNNLFNTNWVIAPASVDSLDGLGPLFNRVACSSCHLRDGRGQPPKDENEAMMSMIVRLSIPGERRPWKSHVKAPKPHPVYGDQLSDRAIPGVPAEGRVGVSCTEVERRFEDGETYTLAVPKYTFKDLGYGPLGDDILFSPRVAPQMIGLGLLEAIPEKTIRLRADPLDDDGDGISGKVNEVWDEIRHGPALGRFGWKANVPSIRQQNAGAARGDLGMTNSVFPEENVTDSQTAAKAARSGGKPELSDGDLDKITFYSRVLAPPARRDVEDRIVRNGQTLFTHVGCAKCHIPTLKTGDSDIEALANQVIHPYTDLLLHDMGGELADGRMDWEANGNEWRTPPLWGIGLFKTVNGHTRYLHDGRARNLMEAVMWHGGEAEKSREAVRKMKKEERSALLKFLESI